MNKKLLFVLPSFGIGGTTVSTLNLIKLLNRRDWRCSVLPLQDNGELKDLYNGITVVGSPFVLQAISASSFRSFDSLSEKLLAAIIRFLSNHFEVALRFFMKNVFRVISGNDYAAIIATQESLPSKLVARFPQTRKIAWVRCDYKNYLQRSSREKETFYYSFDAIICVSKQGLKSFLSVYPDLKEKSSCIPNPQDSEYIKERSETTEKDERFNTDVFTLISVGRLDPVKRYPEIPKIAKNLASKGLLFKWYIIGDGVEKQEILKQIENYDVSDYVQLLGAKQNPHYYIKRADLYVCLSSTESCPRVVNEAKILGTPTVSTDYPSIYEFIENGVTGWIGEMCSISELVMKVMTDKEAYGKVLNNIQSFQFDNTEILADIEHLFTEKR